MRSTLCGGRCWRFRRCARCAWLSRHSSGSPAACPAARQGRLIFAAATNRIFGSAPCLETLFPVSVQTSATSLLPACRAAIRQACTTAQLPLDVAESASPPSPAPVPRLRRQRGRNEVFTGGLSSYSVFNMVRARWALLSAAGPRRDARPCPPRAAHRWHALPACVARLPAVLAAPWSPPNAGAAVHASPQRRAAHLPAPGRRSWHTCSARGTSRMPRRRRRTAEAAVGVGRAGMPCRARRPLPLPICTRRWRSWASWQRGRCPAWRARRSSSSPGTCDGATAARPRRTTRRTACPPTSACCCGASLTDSVGAGLHRGAPGVGSVAVRRCGPGRAVSSALTRSTKGAGVLRSTAIHACA